MSCNYSQHEGHIADLDLRISNLCRRPERRYAGRLMTISVCRARNKALMGRYSSGVLVNTAVAVLLCSTKEVEAIGRRMHQTPLPPGGM